MPLNVFASRGYIVSKDPGNFRWSVGGASPKRKDVVNAPFGGAF